MKTQWKNRVNQTALAALMVTMALGAGSASAAETGAQEQGHKQFASTITYSATTPFQPAYGSSSLLLQPAIERNYFKLLASTYAPETVGDWKQALEERKQLDAQLPKLTSNFVIMKRAVQANDSENTKSDETASFEGEKLGATLRVTTSAPATSTTPNDTSESSKNKSDSSALIQLERNKYTILPQDLAWTQGQSQALPVETIQASDIMKAEPTEAFKRQQKLTEAIEADDSASIRSLLPELLKDYRNETESLRTLIKNLQTGVSKP
ncbi:hypothetical protein GK047_25355 [Paenibacillus sp. SYP-B3998]|uniref:Uncharacterized protein n=1 Tax=Paenibacillus sp. SYP-B3998 TaxID=2678564 RepID=A0A6G4A5S4_9BACL|nr:hypothetical protein [Paenibacillus sp. SYP-B3998]NEW09294.1 hypothetical protein [Paenibacillus sp. SYP-B3998]